MDSEDHSLLDKVESVGWDAIPRQNSSRSFTHQRPSFSPRRTHRAEGHFVWFNRLSGSLCSAAVAQISRRFGNQVPLPATKQVMCTDPRASNNCTRPSPHSSPRPLIHPEPPPVAPATPATSIVQPVPPTVPSIPLRSQLVHPPPSHRARVRAPASSWEVKSPEPEATESLSVRGIPESGGEPTPPLLFLKQDFKPASREATSSSPKNAKKPCPTSEVYASLLRAHGVASEAIKGASLEDLRVLAQLLTPLPEGKSFRETPQ